MAWLTDQLENRMLFRRLYATSIGAYIWMVTHQSFQYLFIAAEKGASSIDIVANLAAVVAFPTAIMGWVFGKYSDARASSGK